MAQVVPSLTSLPIDSTAAPSVEDIQARLPSICVDYLSHDWAEEDVWASWRSMTRHKNEIANGVRLENASWRTWWKQRNKLKTISPETLNWLKDSDVTWLYGPLHTAVEPVPPPKVATAEERLGLSRADSGTVNGVPTKPILKHRTLSEMLSIPNPSSPILEAVRAEEVDDHDLDESRPILLHTKSDTNIVTKGHHQRRKSPPRGPITSGSRTPQDNPSSGQRTPVEGVLPPAQASKKHISFNTFVEQCIAVDDPEEIPGIEGTAIDEQDEDDDEDDDAVLEMRSMSSASSSARSNSIRSNSTRSSRPSLSRQGSSSSQPDHMTIAKIAPTMLKTMGDFPSPSPQLAYAPTGEYAERHGGGDEDDVHDDEQVDAAYKQQASSGYPVGNAKGGDVDGVSPEPVTSPTWDDEDDYAVGFDYFSGPDLGVGDEYDTAAKRGGAGTRTVQTHLGGGASYGKQQAATVGQAPQQPKWRSPSSGTSSSSTSGTASPNTKTPTSYSPNKVSSPTSPENAGISSPPQPGRSILKIRTPGSQQPYYEETSPTNSHFNWKPSAATGQGGLEQGVRRVIKEPVAGSLPSYDVNDSYFGQTGSGGAGNETPPLQPLVSTEKASGSTSPARDGESRGRSAVRTGVNIAERSASRGTGSAAATSISPSSSRMAAQPPTNAKSSSKSSTATADASGPKSPPLATDKPSAPQVQRPVGLGGTMPKDSVAMMKEEKAEKAAAPEDEVESEESRSGH